MGGLVTVGGLGNLFLGNHNPLGGCLGPQRFLNGGIKGAVGIAEDRADASLSCHQTGPISLNEKIKAGKEDGEDVFKKRTSLVFKSMQVVRFYDKKHNVLVYMVYSDRILKGSPNNSISGVPILPWQQQSQPAKP